MVEAEANSELVHLTRTMQHERAIAHNATPPPPSPSLEVFAAALTHEATQAKLDATETASSHAHAMQPDLAIAAALVVLLFIAWVLQRKGSTK